MLVLNFIFVGNLCMQVEGPPRKRGKLKMTYMRVVKIDTKKYNLYKSLAQDGEIECL